jgi:hypothetical protein
MGMQFLSAERGNVFPVNVINFAFVCASNYDEEREKKLRQQKKNRSNQYCLCAVVSLSHHLLFMTLQDKLIFLMAFSAFLLHSSTVAASSNYA